MKTNAIIRIVIWSFVLVLLVGILLYGLMGFPFNRPWREVLITSPAGGSPVSAGESAAGNGQTISLDTPIQDLEIEWVSGTILLQPGDVDTIQFQSTAPVEPKYETVWSVKDGKLSIQFCKETQWSGFHFNRQWSKDLTVTVPRDFACGSLEVDAASTTLRVVDMNIQEVEIDCASTDSVFENCAVGELDLDCASGDLRYSGILHSLDGDMASLDVTAVLSNVPYSIDLDIASGGLDLTLPENAGFTLTMDAMSSDFTSDFPTTTRNGSHICGDGACRINIDGMSTDVVIRMGPDPITYTIPTTQPLSLNSTHHVHSDHCTTYPDTCPDSTWHLSGCRDSLRKAQQVTVICAETHEELTTLTTQSELEAFVAALDLEHWTDKALPEDAEVSTIFSLSQEATRTLLPTARDGSMRELLELYAYAQIPYVTIVLGRLNLTCEVPQATADYLNAFLP